MQQERAAYWDRRPGGPRSRAAANWESRLPLPTGERGRQIAAVRKLVREARANGKKMSVLRACRAVWRAVNGGYPSPEALYDYCHSHKTEF